TLTRPRSQVLWTISTRTACALPAFRVVQTFPKWEGVGYSLILGGALGNAVDRLLRGAVVDFLDFHWHGAHWPAFNLADVAISLGAICLLSATMHQGKRDVAVSGQIPMKTP
uniref:signal peptidase II n=1 Tax=Xenophilus azovorans TaxID=151755 RepID=UPI001FE0EE04